MSDRYCHKCDMNFFGEYCPNCGTDYTWDEGSDAIDGVKYYADSET